MKRPEDRVVVQPGRLAGDKLTILLCALAAACDLLFDETAIHPPQDPALERPHVGIDDAIRLAKRVERPPVVVRKLCFPAECLEVVHRRQ